MRYFSLIIFTLAGCFLAPDVLESQDCIYYEDYIHLVDGIDVPGDARGVAVSGGYAYVADYGSGLQVVDITNPQSPVIVVSVDTPYLSQGVFVYDSYAYVVGRVYGEGDLQVVDVMDPRSPVIVGSIDTPGYARGVTVSGGYVYVADGSSGLHILPPQCDVTSINDEGTGTPSFPQAFRLSQNYPNPFNPSTMIEFDVAGTSVVKQRVQLTVYNIRGKEVIRLVDSEYGPGSHRVVWNGRNDKGEQVSSGIYFYTLRIRNQSYTNKMVVLR
ncbi:MAG: T9SS type A sorting domain-containing protein [Candidatus Glassbacteria bacterium]